MDFELSTEPERLVGNYKIVNKSSRRGKQHKISNLVLSRNEKFCPHQMASFLRMSLMVAISIIVIDIMSQNVCDGMAPPIAYSSKK